MKALILTWEFPPRIIGGISTHVYELSRALVRKDVSVHVLTCGFPNAPSEEVTDGVQVSRVACDRFPETNFFLWTYDLNRLMIERGSQVLEGDSFNLIHAHDWIVAKAALELKNRSALPLLTTIHATEAGRSNLNGTQNGYQKSIHDIEDFLMHHSEQVICCSNYMREHIQENFNMPSDKVNVIPNAIDVSRFNQPSTPLKANNGNVILFVGRLVREKGLNILLDAFEKLPREGAAKLVLVGNGPLKDDLIDEVRRRGRQENVQITGFVDEETLASWYRSSQVFVLPSLYEPFGIVVLEAMANSLPVVVSDVGGLSEIVENDVTGVKVPPGDVESLMRALERVLEDRAFSDRLRKNAYQCVIDRYDPNVVADRTVQVYSKALTEPRVPVTLHDEDFLVELGLQHLLFTAGATSRESSMGAREISDMIGAPELSVKLVLGKLASKGYVTAHLDRQLDAQVRYYLTERGITAESLKAFTHFS